MSTQSANLYCVTAHKATAVVASVCGHFTSPNDTNLIVAKNSRIEIFTATPDGLRLLKELNISGRIAVMELFRPRGEQQDSLFILTTRYSAMILECSNTNGELTVVTRAHGNVQDRVGRPSETGIIGLIDPQNRVIALRLYDALIKVIPLERDMKELKAFNIRMEESAVIDMCFLHGTASPTLAFIYQDTNGRHLKSYEILLKDKEFGKSPLKQENIEASAALVIPVPDPIGGVITVGDETIIYIRGHLNYIAIAPHQFTSSCIVCYGRVDATRYLLGDMAGNLFMLALETTSPSTSVASSSTAAPLPLAVRAINIQRLGETTIPETITYVDNGVVFIGSRLGDSQLLRLTEEPNPENNGKFFAVLETFTNIGPILDMVAVDIEHQGQSQVQY